MVDKDGKTTFSVVRATNCNISNWIVSLYPNPALDNIDIVLTGVQQKSVSLIIINMQGQTVWKQPVQISNVYRKLSIPLKHFSPGIYKLKIMDGDYNQTLSFIKQ